MKCSVNFCNNVKGKVSRKSFFSFPSDVGLSKIWSEFCQRKKEFNTKHAGICEDNFNVNCFDNELQINMGYAKRKVLKHGSIPTIISKQVASEQQEPCAEDEDKENAIVDFDITDKQCKNVGTELRQPLQNVPTKQANTLQKKIELLRKDNRLLRSALRNSLKEIRKLKETSSNAKTKLEYDFKILEERCRKIEYAKENMECKLKTIFTEGQINKMQTDVKQLKWSEDDIAQSITLYSTSAKAYKLLYKKGFPLPGIRTLQNWAKRIHISSGIIEPVFKILSASVQMTAIQKLCVLSFDEMKIEKKYLYCRTSDSTLAPANYVQVAMLRGLMSKWKQPIFYDFDCKITVDLLKHILQRTTSCGYTVAALVCDLGGE